MRRAEPVRQKKSVAVKQQTNSQHGQQNLPQFDLKLHIQAPGRSAVVGTHAHDIRDIGMRYWDAPRSCCKVAASAKVVLTAAMVWTRYSARRLHQHGSAL
jgi:hypothetical protein